MAIDTQNKRRSTVAVLPVADGAIGTQDRPHVCWIYAGLVIGALADLVEFPLTVIVNQSPTVAALCNPSPSYDVTAQPSPSMKVRTP